MQKAEVILTTDLVGFINEQTEEIIKYIVGDNTDEITLDNYTVDGVNFCIGLLSKKHRYEVHGACGVLLGLVRTGDLTIHKRAYNFLRAIEDKAYKN